MAKRIIIIMSVFISGCSSWNVGDWRMASRLVGAWQFKDPVLGSLVLTFRKDQTFEVDSNADGRKDIWGRYELWEKRVKFTDDKPRDITDCFEPGFYYYAVENNELRFELLADHCRPRKYVLSLPMVRQPTVSAERK